MKRGACNSPKMKALGRAIAQIRGLDPDVGRNVATALLHRLWEWVAEYAPTGAIEPRALEDLGEELSWSGELGPVLEAMRDERSRWLDVLEDGRLFIHDWPEHCEDSVNRKLARAHMYFACGCAPKLTRLTKRDGAEGIRPWYAEHPGSCARHAPEPGARPAPGLRTTGARPAPQPGLALPGQASEEDRDEVKDRGELSRAREAPAPPDGGRGTLSLLEQAKRPGSPSPPGRRDYKAEARAKWPDCQQAAAQHGRHWRPLKPHRLAELAACLAMFPEEGPEILVEAIHGACAYWKATMPPGSQPSAYLNPETVYARKNFVKYFEAYHDPKINRAMAARHAPPPERPPDLSPEQRAAAYARWDSYFDEHGRARKRVEAGKDR